jgi:hypothetical protein
MPNKSLQNHRESQTRLHRYNVQSNPATTTTHIKVDRNSRAEIAPGTMIQETHSPAPFCRGGDLGIVLTPSDATNPGEHPTSRLLGKTLGDVPYAETKALHTSRHRLPRPRPGHPDSDRVLPYRSVASAALGTPTAHTATTATPNSVRHRHQLLPLPITPMAATKPYILSKSSNLKITCRSPM